MTTTRKTGIFATLYCTRINVRKDNATIANLSLLFGLIALLTAPWLVIGGVIAALALGYKFSVGRNDEGFNGDFDTVVEQAGQNIRTTVERVTNPGDRT